MYLTLSQAAKELDRTERQVRYLVKTGVLSPVNQDTYKRDGGYRFSLEVVEQIKDALKPEGISLRKAAEIVGVTPQYLNSFALKGTISSELVLIGNKKERRFQEKDCLEFRDKIQKRTHRSIARFGEKLRLFHHNLRLFEFISYEQEKIRVVKTEPVVFLKADGTLFHPSSDSDLPKIEQWEEQPYRTKKGFIAFRFPIPRNAEHMTYNLIYILIEGLGPKNIQVFEQNDGDYYVRCRQGKVLFKREHGELLRRYLVEGDLLFINDTEIELQASIVSQYIHLPRELFEEIEKLARTRSISTQQQLVETVTRGLNSFRSDQ